MSVRYSIEGVTLAVRLHGSYEFREVLGTVQLAFADPRFLPGMSLLIDERTSVMNPSGTEKRERVKSLASLRPKIGPRIGLLTSTDPLRYGLARLAAVYFDTEGMEAQVFTEPSEAMDWLSPGPAGNC